MMAESLNKSITIYPVEDMVEGSISSVQVVDIPSKKT